MLLNNFNFPSLAIKIKKRRVKIKENNDDDRKKYYHNNNNKNQERRKEVKVIKYVK